MSEQGARDRIANDPVLEPHTETIFYDWPNWDEHMEWLITAPVAEIVDWAEVVEQE